MAHVLVFQGVAHTPYEEVFDPQSVSPRVTVSLSTLLPFEREESSETYFEEAEISLICSDEERPVQIVAPCMGKPPYHDTIGRWSVEYQKQNADSWTTAGAIEARIPGQRDIKLTGTRIPLTGSEIPTILRVVYRTSSASSSLSPRPRQLLCQSFTPHDVAFLFPEEGKDAVLWANTGILSQVSSTWKAQFASGFAESTQQLQHLSRWGQLAEKDIQEVMAIHSEGSDTQSEDDSVHNIRAGKRARIESQEASTSRPSASATNGIEENVSSRVGYVVIKGTPLATYRTVFAWLEKGSVTFGQLSASPEAANPTAPDAVYALAHFLELLGLKELALINYSRQLNEDNALVHALGPMACNYDEIRRAAMTVALRHIDAIRASNGPALITQMIIAEDDRRMREHLSGVVEELIKAPAAAAATGSPQQQREAQNGRSFRATASGVLRSTAGEDAELPTSTSRQRVRPRPSAHEPSARRGLTTRPRPSAAHVTSGLCWCSECARFAK